MAIRNFTITKSHPNYGAGVWYGALIEGTAVANKLVTTDTTDVISTAGDKTIRASGTYIKGSSTNGKIDIVVDGVVVASSSVSTTDGEVLTATFTGAVIRDVTILATITGTATGASVNYARLSILDNLFNN